MNILMKRKLSKILSIALIVTLAVSVMITAIPAAALTQPQVSIPFGEEVIDMTTTYLITFTAGLPVPINGDIVVTFPPDTTLPTGAGNVTIDTLVGIGGGGGGPMTASAIVVSGTPGAPQVMTITLAAGQTIGQGSLVGLWIANVKNPSTPDTYTLDVGTAGNQTPSIPIEAAVTSSTYSIVAPHIEPLPGIVLAYNSAGILMSQSQSINTGIAAAGPGGRIEVGPGSYDEDVIANVPGQTIIGTGAPGTVIITDVILGSAGAGTLTITAGEYIPGSWEGVTIDGITIKPNVIIAQPELVTIESTAEYVTITNCEITSGDRAAINMVINITGSKYHNITNCRINTEQNGQFGILADPSTNGLKISECTFSGNGGTGIKIDGGSVSVSKNEFINLDKAILMDGVYNTLILDNTILGNGNGITLVGSVNNTIVNNIVSKNSINGIWLRFYSNGNTLVNNTIVSNLGTGIIASENSTGNLLSNSIIFGNGDDINGIAATYSDISDNDTGAGNISVNPMLMNLAGDDYHLQAGSSCIDSGNNTYIYYDTGSPTDFEGNPRIIDGDLDSTATVDMGADEYTPAGAGLVMSINFHGVELGCYLELDTTLQNTGIVPFTVDNVSRIGGDSLFTVISPLSPVAVLPGESVNITIRFSPVTEISSNAIFKVNTDIPLDSDIDFETEGYGVIILGGCGGIRGDVNGDGEVNVLDMTAIARIILGLE